VRHLNTVTATNLDPSEFSISPFVSVNELPVLIKVRIVLCSMSNSLSLESNSLSSHSRKSFRYKLESIAGSIIGESHIFNIRARLNGHNTLCIFEITKAVTSRVMHNLTICERLPFLIIILYAFGRSHASFHLVGNRYKAFSTSFVTEMS